MIPTPEKAHCNPECHACDFRKFSYLDTLKIKEEKFRSLFPNENRAPVLPPPSPLGYRRSVQLYAQYKSSQWIFGFRKRILRDKLNPDPEKYRILSLETCPLHSEDTSGALQYLAKNLPEYSERDFPLVGIRTTGQIFTYVFKSKPFGLPDALPKSALQNFGFVEGYAHFQPAFGNRFTNHQGWERLWSTPAPRLSYGPRSFQQQILELQSVALEKILKFSESSTHLLDLYSGTAECSALYLQTSDARTATAVELNGEACNYARRRLASFGPRAQVFQGRCEDRLPQLASFPKGKTHLHLNPPGSGLSPEVLTFVAENAAFFSGISYLSCHAANLARDLKALQGKTSVQIHELHPYDFFPFSKQIETLALLTLRPS
jgi:tRNA/tmRNA/rRNA uracil-C5-methylase (TrmA/RlmC/RlmD family)